MSNTAFPEIQTTCSDAIGRVSLLRIRTSETEYSACSIHAASNAGVTFSPNDWDAGGWNVPYKHRGNRPTELITVPWHDVIEAERDVDAEAYRTSSGENREKQAVSDAYRVISQALNVGRERFLLEAIEKEHPTLLGKLWNTVQAACELREGDPRLAVPNKTLDELVHRTGWNGNTKLCELRTPLI